MQKPERQDLASDHFYVNLHRALELFEDPADTQAWCCTNAERKAIANEFIPIENEIDDYYSLSSNSNIDSDIEDDEDEYQNEDEGDDEIDDSEEDIIINDEFITSELNTDFMQSIEEYKENSQSDLSKQADQLYPLDSDWLTYHYSVHENFTPDQCEQQLQQPQDVESSSQTFPPSLTLFSQLPYSVFDYTKSNCESHVQEYPGVHILVLEDLPA
ncbi:unnamed protein product [Trichobilharzia regenti]|nr:unnamed protein product [Trichobilharzia regenti]